MSSVISHLVNQIREASVYNPNTQDKPAAVLWTDKECQWQPVMSKLLEVLPELLILGDIKSEQRTGPAIWLKCVVARTLAQEVIPDELTPVIYLPGISRSELRDVVNCPDALKPLAELQYRGALYSQYNGKDWTVNAFLTSASYGLDLDIAQDQSTQQAMLRALEELLENDVRQLEGRRLEESDFNQLVTRDPIRELLSWMNAPDDTRARLSDSGWQVLCDEARRDYDLDLECDGVFAAAEKLCEAAGRWQHVWDRYAQMPDLYPALPDLLLRVELPDMFADVDRYPRANEQQEQRLLKSLQDLAASTTEEARTGLKTLEKEHGDRRQHLWARLGKSPWIMLLEPLVQVACSTQNALGGLTSDEIGERYSADGWQADAAALTCIRICSSKLQTTLVVELLKVIYTPWLEQVNERFQKHVADQGYPGGASKTSLKGVNEAVANYESSGECVFFVDGLRLDVAHQLMDLLAEVDLNPILKTQWAALPSVTATAKAAVSPVADYLMGLPTDKDFEPSVIGEGALSHDRFKRTLKKMGWQYLEEDDFGDPGKNAWTATGDIDKEGHKSEFKLPSRIPYILNAIVERIQELQQSGWKKIRIVTDHGWLLVPGNLPKYNLPSQAVDSRWGRCAQLKPGVEVDGLTMGWYWDPSTAIHFPPGIHSYIAGRAYAHGGVSLQECLIPVIILESATRQLAEARITAVRWLGLTCKIEVDSNAGKLFVDLRTKLADSETSLVKVKPVDDGKCSLMVADDDHEGLQALVVVLDEDGNVLAKQVTQVGGDE